MLIVLDALGIVPDVPFVKLALGVVCLAWFIKELFALKIHGTVFPLAFIFMLFEKEIGTYLGKEENFISNWLVLLAALLLSGGLGMIFGNIRIKKIGGHHSPRHIDGKVNKNRFSGKTFYIDCADFNYEVINNEFGASEIYFQNSDLYDGGVLEINNKFGAVEVYVPSEWNVVCDVNSVFGAVEQDGVSASGGKTLTVKGQNRFGAIEIYVK